MAIQNVSSKIKKVKPSYFNITSTDLFQVTGLIISATDIEPRMKRVPLSSNCIRPSPKSTAVPSDLVHVIVGLGLPTAMHDSDTFLKMSTTRFSGRLMIVADADTKDTRLCGASVPQ